MARKAPISPTDPSEPEQVEASEAPGSLIVEIALIQPYERNPRHGRNPEYDRIKDSIRSNGLDQPLVITQRPQANDYIVHAGGNTRLLILKELFEETSDERFSRIQCVCSDAGAVNRMCCSHIFGRTIFAVVSLLSIRRARSSMQNNCSQRIWVSKKFH